MDKCEMSQDAMVGDMRGEKHQWAKCDDQDDRKIIGRHDLDESAIDELADGRLCSRFKDILGVRIKKYESAYEEKQLHAQIAGPLEKAEIYPRVSNVEMRGQTGQLMEVKPDDRENCDAPQPVDDADVVDSASGSLHQND